MSENETIGRMTCPICGEPMQDVRISKNGKLYMICDNNCRVNFSGKQSKQFLPKLRAGQNIKEGNIYINVIGGKTYEQIRTGTRESIGQSNRDTIIGRSDIGNTGAAAGAISTASKPAAKRGIFAGFLDDDDE